MRQELLLALCGRLVGLDAQQQIVAPSRPDITLCHIMNHITVCWCIIFTLSVFHFSVDALLNDVASLRRTVVIEIVVTVYTVFWAQILSQSITQS